MCVWEVGSDGPKSNGLFKATAEKTDERGGEGGGGVVTKIIFGPHHMSKINRGKPSIWTPLT